VSVRDATPADRAYIADLGRRTVAASVAAFRKAPDAMVRSSYDRLLEIVYSQSFVGLIAHDEATPIGFLLMLDELPDEVTSSEQGFIAYMAVEPSCRQRGAGAALLAAAEDEARRRGLPYMGLMVTQDNVAARTLYERAGYVTERRLLCKEL
jgi:ribosomal protein S18 acetylase RimI-like enzyme